MRLAKSRIIRIGSGSSRLKLGMMPREAAKYAKVSNPTDFISRAMKDPWVIEQAKQIRDEMESKMEMSREKVQSMVVKAYDMAELQAVPGDMVRACAELNKMLGYYAPEEKVVSIQSGQLAEDLATMDEDKLLELAGQELDYIEGEFEALDEIHHAENA
jgi:hypothetical protein